MDEQMTLKLWAHILQTAEPAGQEVGSRIRNTHVTKAARRVRYGHPEWHNRKLYNNTDIVAIDEDLSARSEKQWVKMRLLFHRLQRIPHHRWQSCEGAGKGMLVIGHELGSPTRSPHAERFGAPPENLVLCF